MRTMCNFTGSQVPPPVLPAKNSIACIGCSLLYGDAMVHRGNSKLMVFITGKAENHVENLLGGATTSS